MDYKIAGIKDRKKWDNFLAEQPNGNFRQSFAWGQIKKLAGWEPVYLYMKDGGEIRAAISMLNLTIIMKLKFVSMGI